MYDNGQGVTQDYSEAVRRYRISAEKWLPEAEDNLGLMYAGGCKGVNRNC